MPKVLGANDAPPCRCKHCRYYEPVESVCRRMSPIWGLRYPKATSEVLMSLPRQGCAWPVVEIDDWCGEFKGAGKKQ